MKQGYKNNDLLMAEKPINLRALYDRYADELLGYILPIVSNRELAEESIVKIFTNISSLKNTLPENAYTNTRNWLMTLANNEVERLVAAKAGCKSVVDDIAYIQSHKYLNQMSDLQRRVFCGVYHHRKTTAVLADELNLPEQQVRLSLKEAFKVIREVKDEN